MLASLASPSRFSRLHCIEIINCTPYVLFSSSYRFLLRTVSTESDSQGKVHSVRWFLDGRGNWYSIVYFCFYIFVFRLGGTCPFLHFCSYDAWFAKPPTKAVIFCSWRLKKQTIPRLPPVSPQSRKHYIVPKKQSIRTCARWPIWHETRSARTNIIVRLLLSHMFLG